LQEHVHWTRIIKLKGEPKGVTPYLRLQVEWTLETITITATSFSLLHASAWVGHSRKGKITHLIPQIEVSFGPMRL